MRLISLLSLVILGSCSVGPTSKIDSKNDVYASDMYAPNDCQSKFVTSFDNVGLLFTPLKNTIEYSLQVSNDNSLSKARAFTQNAAECTALHKAVTPFLFSEPKGMLKNDLSLRIFADKAEGVDLKPGIEIPVNFVNVELLVRHQLLYAGSEKNTKTVLRVGNIPGSIKCPEPFMLSCEFSRKENVCGTLVLNPPNADCELTFSAVAIKISQTSTLKGNLGGKLSFVNFENDKKATMTIEQVDSLALVKD